MRLKLSDGHVDASRASDEDQMVGILVFLLHAWHGEISAVHLRSNGHDVTITIFIYAFNQSHWSKMKRQIRRFFPNFAYLYECSLIENVFLDVSSYWTV